MSGVAKNIFHLLTSSVLQKAIAFVYFALIARWAGVEDTGAYFFALSWTLMFTTITDMGLTPVLIREAAKDKTRTEKYLNQTLALKLPLTVVAVLAAVVGAWLFRVEPGTRLLVTLAAVVISLDAISLTFYGVLRAHHVLKYEGLGLVVGQTVTMVIGLASLKLGAPLAILVVALIAGSSWNALASIWIVRKRLGIRARLAWDWGFAKAILRMAVPFALAGAFVKVYTSADAVLLTHFKGEAAAGLYSVPYKLTFAFQFVPMAFTAAFYPAMSRAYAADKRELGDLFYKALWALMLIAAPIAAGIMALAPELVDFVYGQDYLPAVAALQVLIVSVLPIFLDFPIGSLLNASDRQMTQTKLMGMATVISVVLNLALIPAYGLTGVVIASVVSHAALLLGGFIMVGKFLEWPALKFAGVAIRATLAASAMFVGVTLAKAYVPFPAAVLVGVVLYPAAAFALRAVTVADLKGLLRSVRAPSVPPPIATTTP
ncbi:MAG TPA: flippase [Patescibacteria group bacterium]|nr:flippase [Patescibacteria group bacterium]